MTGPITPPAHAGVFENSGPDLQRVRCDVFEEIAVPVGKGCPMGLIEVENLSVTFRAKGRDVRAVEGVSLSVDARESYGLVGESGSGKSTILRAICGMAPVTGGTIRIGGDPLPTPRGRAFSTQVQMVFQDPYASLHPRHTIDRTLSEPLAIHGLPDTRHPRGRRR